MSIRRLQAIACTWLLCGQVANAQGVQGVVLSRRETPVSGVVVLLLDTGSVITARALTDERGAFRLVTRQPGVYRLRTLRIGYTPVASEAFTLDAGGLRTEQVILAELPYSMGTTRVESRRVCRPTSPESLAVVFALWEQARTALHAAELTASAGRLDATTLRYARLFRRDMSTVVAQANEFRTASAGAPWQSFVPDTLHARGYVRTGADDSVTYAAPGLDALLSDAFLADHCFSLASASDDEMRIAFEPSSDRARVPEIAGTVALGRATADLRRIDFRYVNLPAVQMTQAGGGVTFARLRDGSWIIPRWDVRMPVLGLFRGAAHGARELRVARVRGEGGELVAAVRDGDTLWRHPPLVLSGRVLDSASGAPVAGARVSVSGSKLLGETGRDGTFRIAGVLPGAFGLEVRGPGREYAGMAVAIPVTFTDSASRVELRIPTARQVAGAVCNLERLVTPVSGGAIVTGHVDASLSPASHGPVTVVAEWNEYRYAGVAGISYESVPMSLETVADAAGDFRICFVPTETAVLVHATAGDIRARDARILIPPELHFARVDLTLDSNLEPVTSLSAVVVGDSTVGPVSGAEVALPELSLFGATDDRGALRLTEVALGAHKLTVRRAGFAPLDTTIVIEKATPVQVRLVLRAQATDATVTPPKGAAPVDSPGVNESRGASRTPRPPPLPTRETASPECSPPSAPLEAPRARAAAACAR